jgi:subtilisin-like proprotein convertase family protein/subtilisin family serine protease
MRRLTSICISIACLGLGCHLALAQSESVGGHFQFRLPRQTAYRVDASEMHSAAMAAKVEWLNAWPDDGSTNFVELGSRVVLQLNDAADLKRLTAGTVLELSRTVASNIFILQAPDALTAAREAHRLAALPEVLASYPVMRRHGNLHGLYALRSNDPFFVPYFVSYPNPNPKFEAQWPLENRDYDGTRLGLDLNVLAAWPYGQGAGVTVAVADGGLEMNHPELTNRLAGAPHFNFANQTTNAVPFGGTAPDPNMQTWTHGTSIAGLIAAEANNGRGMAGVAPLAHLASWVIFDTNTALVSDEMLMDMYQFASDTVSIQNHSWGGGNGVTAQVGPTLLEQVGIANAVTLGRNGLGTVMVRSAGNDRSLVARADDDGYPDDPEVIAVAAVVKGGRATSYSEPGACILVAAPGGGGDTTQGLFTLDLLGWERGVNSVVHYNGDLSDYRWGSQGFTGTSASAPLVSGVAALVMSVNTNFSYRDVQQILLLSAKHWDLADPDLTTNGAGFLVSHNVGFGVPDAGQAVRLARTWSNRPPLTTLTVTDSRPLPIPDAGLRVEVTGDGIPPELASIQAFPTFAPRVDGPLPSLPMVDIGVATNVPLVNLTNKGALILRDSTAFDTKISNAAKAGAAFAVIYDSTNGGSFNLGLLAGTDYSPIPAVFIGNSSGEALKALFQTNSSAVARIRLLSADRVFHVNSTLLCEHVGVRVQIDHPLRGDLRITLLSPQGTRSVLQQFNDDINSGPADWTYWSTHHFFESSAGDWTVSVTDEAPGNTGTVRSASLIIRGTQITDSDHDGLDDNWEIAHFGSLALGPKDDPAGDGFSNARKQVMGTDPLAANSPFQVDLGWWELAGYRLARLSWPSTTQYSYNVWGGTNVGSFSLLPNVPGQFPETDLLVPYGGIPQQFFRIYSSPNSPPILPPPPPPRTGIQQLFRVRAISNP